MEQVLLVIQVILAASLIGMVLLQRSETDGFGLGGGGGSNLLSGRAKANLLTRTTAIIAGLFIVNSLILSVMAAHNHPSSIVETIDKEEQSTAPLPNAKENKPSMAVEKTVAPKDKDTKSAPVEEKSAIPSIPNADETKVETKPVVKAVKKVKPPVDADREMDRNEAE